MNPADMIAASVPPRAPKPPAKSKSSSDFPEFDAPPSFSPPADAEPGQDFQAVGTFRMKEDGKMVLVAVDGSSLSDKEPDKSDPAEASEGEGAPSMPGEPGGQLAG